MKASKQFIHSNQCPLVKIVPGVNWCTICEVSVQLENDLIAKEHENGKRHQQNLKETKFIDLFDYERSCESDL